jgi:hypothetical protein
MTPTPDFTLPEQLPDAVRTQGHAALDTAGLCALCHLDIADLLALDPSWHDLPADEYLRDGGHYRRRRHASLIIDGNDITQVPHRAHWQPVEYNALHGGLERWFAPIDATLLQSPACTQLLRCLAVQCSAVKGMQRWFVEAHQFRIDTTGGIGRPTPEGAHRDGVDFVFVILVARHGVKGGESRVFDADGPRGIRFTLSESWTLLMLDDERVVHETTPIQPAEPGTAAYRDTLVLTFRRNGFQEAPSLSRA